MKNTNIKQAQIANLSRIKVGTKAGLGNINGATGCSGKIVFFHSSLQPLPRLHIAVRDLQNSQGSASVQSLLLAVFFYNIRRVLARERWQTFENSWETHNI